MNLKQNAVIKSNRSGMTINLDPDAAMEDILAELAGKFQATARFWGKNAMMLTLKGRKLSCREEMDIVNVIAENSGLQILGLLDTDEENIRKNDAELKRRYMEYNLLTGSFHQGSVRQGEIISVEPSIVIIGDVQKGALVESSGNIIVLGELSGTAKAGSCGNRDAMVVAFVLNSDDVGVDGITLKSSGVKVKSSSDPGAVLFENGALTVHRIKKSFLSLLTHKKCW
jgi:septum site-determining protein MinC